jgi:hypothetical protein
MRKAAIRFLVLTAIACAAPGAFAQEGAASVLKQKGDDALGQKRYGDALAAYEAAYAMSPSPALLYNRGRALQFLARYPEAFEKKATPDLLARVRGLPELLADLRSNVSTLTIHCETPGARVLVGQRQVGATPLSGPLRVNAGKQSIDVFADGFFPYHREAVLPGAGQITIDVVLSARDRSGLLIVKSSLSGVEVKVDDKSLGLAPAEVGLLAGAHQVLVDKDGYKPASTQIVLQIGERKELSLDPVSRPPVYAQWWFWTGIGVVVAGVATTAILLTTERPAPNGEFSPGRLSF